jgi:predicted ATPase
VPAIRELPLLDVEVPVTIFVGENGSGKSTLLEGMAACAQLRSFGANDPTDDDSLARQRELANALRMAWRPRSRRGFFMRAEDFLDFCACKRASTPGFAARAPSFEESGSITDYRLRAHGTSMRSPPRRTWAATIRGRMARAFSTLFRSRLEPRGLYPATAIAGLVP